LPKNAKEWFMSSIKIKKILIITLLTFMAKSQNTNGTISMDLGVPKGVLGIGYFNIKDNYYGRFEVKFLGNPSDDTYDFAPDVFGDDEDRGKVSNYSALGGGFLYKLKTKQIIHAGILFGFSDQYFKKYDSAEILADNGIYYVKDDSGGSVKFSPNIGVLIPTNKYNNYNYSGMLSMGLSVNPMNFYIGYGLSW